MRTRVPLTGDTRVKKMFALIPIVANCELRWFEFVKIHQTYHGKGIGWNNDWFE